MTKLYLLEETETPYWEQISTYVDDIEITYHIKE